MIDFHVEKKKTTQKNPLKPNRLTLVNTQFVNSQSAILPSSVNTEIFPCQKRLNTVLLTKQNSEKRLA